jgi:hypothetical protein
MVDALKREVNSSTVGAAKSDWRMCFVAWGEIGIGDLICETERGRPLGMSTAKLSRGDSRREEDECFSRDEECFEEWEDEDLLDEECLEELELLWDEDDLLEDFSRGTSRMFNTRPVVGSVVEETAGSWETWYPSMM